MSGFLRLPLLQTALFRNCVKTQNTWHIANFSKSNARFKTAEDSRVNPFTLAGVRKHYELVPLVAIVGAGAVALCVYAAYFCTSRNDVQFRSHQGAMDLHKPPVLKMVRTADYNEYRPLVELDGLLKEMAEEEAKQQS